MYFSGRESWCHFTWDTVYVYDADGRKTDQDLLVRDAQVIGGCCTLHRRSPKAGAPIGMSVACLSCGKFLTRIGPVPNVMAALPNIGGALCSTSQFG